MPTTTRVARLACSATSCAPHARGQEARPVIRVRAGSTWSKAPLPACPPAPTTLPITTSMERPASSATLSATHARGPGIPSVRSVPPTSTQWRAPLLPVLLLAQTMPLTSSLTAQSASNAMLPARPARPLSPSTATPAPPTTRKSWVVQSPIPKSVSTHV